MNPQALLYLSFCSAFNSDDEEDEEILQQIVDETLICLQLLLEDKWN